MDEFRVKNRRGTQSSGGPHTSMSFTSRISTGSHSKDLRTLPLCFQQGKERSILEIAQPTLLFLTSPALRRKPN